MTNSSEHMYDPHTHGRGKLGYVGKLNIKPWRANLLLVAMNRQPDGLPPY